MATQPLIDVTTYVGAYDMTTDLNEISLEATAEELDDTRFRAVGASGPHYRSRKKGNADVAAALNGWWDSPVDDAAFADLTAAATPRLVTVAPTAVEGGLAYFFRGARFTYESFGASAGELSPFSLSMSSAGGTPLVRGALAVAKQNVAVTGTLLGTAVQLGVVDAGQSLYAGVHVFSVGTTITVTVASDDSNAFSSAVTHTTIGPITAAGSYSVEVPGPITDNWWKFAVTAVTGTSSIAATFGIAPSS